jgi:hypothetical protein
MTTFRQAQWPFYKLNDQATGFSSLASLLNERISAPLNDHISAKLSDHFGK